MGIFTLFLQKYIIFGHIFRIIIFNIGNKKEQHIRLDRRCRSNLFCNIWFSVSKYLIVPREGLEPSA